MATPIQIVRKVHWDDIHGLIPLGSDFISGSKDGSLKRWSEQGKLLEVVREIATGENGALDYTKWVTALCTVNDQTWVSGSRDGTITLRREGQAGRTLSLRQDNQPHCKPRNEDRITFLATDASSDANGIIFVGQARSFSLVHLQRGLVRKVTLASNDWLYGMLGVSAQHKLAIVGTALHLLSQKSAWGTEKILYDDKRVFDRERGHRPYISCLVKHSEEGRVFSFGVFDGAVKTIDLSRPAAVQKIGEHQGRVWSVLSPKADHILSSGDDGFARLWDVRIKGRAAMVFGPDVGRVSCLHLLPNETFVAGSCPDRPSMRVPSAQFSFWDMRMAEQPV